MVIGEESLVIGLSSFCHLITAVDSVAELVVGEFFFSTQPFLTIYHLSIMEPVKKSLIVFLILCIGYSCEESNTKTGNVAFGANYGIINCPTDISIYVDGRKIGKLDAPCDEIKECGQPGSLNEELSVGIHLYKVEIKSISGGSCSDDINGSILITEGGCTKVFVDFSNL